METPTKKQRTVYTLVRVPKALHKILKQKARNEGKLLDAVTKEILTKGLDKVA